jgi:hypothetical protein
MRIRIGVGLLFAAVPLLLTAADFWNKKDPAQWSNSEIRQMTSQSPWAKEVRIENRGPGGMNTYDGSAPVGSGLPGDPSSGRPASGTPGTTAATTQHAPIQYPLGGDRQSHDIAVQSVTATVRWESALPVIGATGIPIPSDFQDHYVIGVSGLQIPRAQRPAMLELLRNSAFLQKGKEQIQPGLVEYSRDGGTIFFGFAKELFPLTSADKDVQFTINTGDLRVKAKFEPKEMIYKGRLAL